MSIKSRYERKKTNKKNVSVDTSKTVNHEELGQWLDSMMAITRRGHGELNDVRILYDFEASRIMLLEQVTSY